MTLYTIRPARTTDLAHLPAIEKAAGQLFLASDEAWIVDDDGISPQEFEEHFAYNRIWVAVTQGAVGETVVGFAVARRLEKSVYLHEIDVHPDHGRRGLGRRLIEAVIDWARTEGLHAVTLSTFRDVPWNAPYYIKLGFQPLEEGALEPGLRDVRAHETAAGLDPSRRVCMIVYVTPMAQP